MTEKEYNEQQLTEHFNRKEFACKCGGKYCSPIHNNIDFRIVEICEIIRQYINAPIRISSGCRCDVWNKKNKGVDSSSHRWGFAADLHCDAIGGKKLFEAIQELYKAGKLPNLRYCQYYKSANFCHCDIDVNKKRNNVFATVA